MNKTKMYVLKTILKNLFYTYPLRIRNSVINGITGILENFGGRISFVFFPLQSVDKQ